MNTKVKWWLFRYYAVILFLIFLGSFVCFFFFSDRGIENLTILITAWGGLISFFFFVQKQQLEELDHIKELFNYFNGRYDDLNEKLNAIVNSDPREPLATKEIDTLYDYFNLCGEEYLYFKKGYIYPEVWTAWCNGMKFFLRDKRVEELWAKEDPASYYGLTPAEVRKFASRKLKTSTHVG
jgi:hypothetical protein